MAEAKMSLPVVRGFGETSRHDLWWVQPVAVFLGFAAFIVYSTWAAFQGNHYTYGPYLSPFYSPELFGNSPHRSGNCVSMFGQPRADQFSPLTPFFISNRSMAPTSGAGVKGLGGNAPVFLLV